MIICFQLSMPSNNSWNGKWSGDGVFYARTRAVRDKERAKNIIKEGYFSYSFGDGWRACIDVREVSASQRRQIDKNTKGFCGYDWMIDSIIQYGDIKIGKKTA